MNKTAMQQLIEWLMEQDELLMPKTRMIIIGKADNLTATEKQQIIDAYCEPYNYENHLPADLLDSAEQYYNQTFGQ